MPVPDAAKVMLPLLQKMIYAGTKLDPQVLAEAIEARNTQNLQWHMKKMGAAGIAKLLGTDFEKAYRKVLLEKHAGAGKVATNGVEQPAQQQAPRRNDPRAEEWAEKNTWFGSDVVMTNTVRGIHVELVKNEGFDPQSDEYYDEIDRRMQDLFPKKFSESAPQQTRSSRPVQTVASATRSLGLNNSARRSIRLSPSEVAMAKKLGVPLEKYAQYVKR